MPKLTGPYTDLNPDALHACRASLHNHTFKRRPTASPVAALGLYRLCGIPVVAITDHDRRMPLNGDPPKEGQVPWLLEDFEHNYDDAVLMRGVEASFPGNHVNVLGCAPEALTLKPGTPGYVQAAHELGAYTVLNHPAKWNDEPAHVLDDENLAHCRGIEIYNGGRSSGGFETAEATALWDHWLAAGHRPWALANSDCHMYDFTIASHPTNGYNVLWLDEISEKAVLEALHRGRFYASNGLEIERVTQRDGEIAIEAPDADRIRFIGAEGRVLHEAAGPAATYAPRGDEKYVRIEAHTDRPAYPGAAVTARAWCQPTWIED